VRREASKKRGQEGGKPRSPSSNWESGPVGIKRGDLIVVWQDVLFFKGESNGCESEAPTGSIVREKQEAVVGEQGYIQKRKRKKHREEGLGGERIGGRGGREEKRGPLQKKRGKGSCWLPEKGAVDAVLPFKRNGEKLIFEDCMVEYSEKARNPKRGDERRNSRGKKRGGKRKSSEGALKVLLYC